MQVNIAKYQPKCGVLQAMIMRFVGLAGHIRAFSNEPMKQRSMRP